MRLKQVLFCVLCSTIVSCGIYKDVLFKGIEDFSVKEFSTMAIVVEITAKIDNPNGYNISIYDSDLDLIVNGAKLGKAKIDRYITLKKKSEENYRFLIKADTQDLSSKMHVLFPVLMSGKANVKVKGTVFAKALGVKKKAPIDFAKEISL